MSERDIFLAVIDLPAAARAAYLDAACGTDAALRGRVEGLVRAHEQASSFLGTPAVPPADPDNAGTVSFTPPETDTRSDAEDGGDEMPLTFLTPATRPDSLGRIGHYEVLQVLGRGGFGIVFRAFDEVLQRVVAVKVLSPQMAATSPARKRFLREARSSAAVRHENVVQVYEVGEQPLPYIAMEFIPGETLQQRLTRTGPLDVSEVLRIGRQVAEGLAAAHATDLIHRDIKPGNILLEGGHHKVKITDFGLARAADDASISQSGVIAGTPMYMAPEQAKGERLDHRADLFSLGSVLYQMVTGRAPFRANGTLAVLKRVAEDTPRPIREIIPETPQWLCDIISKLHAKNPADRFQSAREVADLLADWEAQLKGDSKLKDFSRIPRSKQPGLGLSRRGKWIAAALVLVALVGIGVGVNALMSSSNRSMPVSDPGSGEPQTPNPDPNAPPLAVAPFDATAAKAHQVAWGKYLGVEAEATNTIGMKLQLIPPGKFLMGSPRTDPDRGAEEFQHPVTLTKPFYLGAHLVTVQQFGEFVREKRYRTEAERWGGTMRRYPDFSWKYAPQTHWRNPGFEQGDNQPAVCISWNDARAFCDWLSEKERRRYTLPTEAQWEYAGRAGTDTKYLGSDDGRNLSEYALFESGKAKEVRTPAVGQKKPNAWGLYDLHGNVCQWMLDWYALDYYFESPKEDPPGPSSGQRRAIRGAGWCYRITACRMARRSGALPREEGHADMGFRVAIVGDLKSKSLPEVGATPKPVEPPAFGDLDRVHRASR